MAKKLTNHWKEHHEGLNDNDKRKAKEKACSYCEWSPDTFYRKMRSPEKLKFWEKKLVVKAYGVSLEELFPEQVVTHAA